MEKVAVRYYAVRMPSKPPAASDLADKFVLRMPDGMRDRIAAEAKANNRSMNAEILGRIERSLNAPAGPSDIEAFAEKFGTEVLEAMRRSMWRAVMGSEAKDLRPTGLGLLELLRVNHIYESQVLQEERTLTELQAIDYENVEKIKSLAPKAREEWKKAVRKRLPKDEAERMIAISDKYLAESIDNPEPTGPATDAVRAMDVAIGEHRSKRKSSAIAKALGSPSK